MNFVSIGFLKEAYKLQPHQERALKRLDKTDKLLLYHGLGSGKTLTGLAASEKYQEPLNVIGPASLKYNFPKERAKHKIKAPPSQISTYTKPKEGEGITFFDEAHRMGRLESKRSHLPDEIKGKKTIFATGTPIRNYPRELIPLLRGLGVKAGRDVNAFRGAFIKEVKENPNLYARFFKGVKPGVHYEAKNLPVLKKALTKKVDYHAPSQIGYPSVSQEDINVVMTPEQYSAYKMSMKGHPGLAYKIRKGISPSKSESKNLNAFLTASRQISNIPGGYNLKATAKDAPKILKAVEEIEKRVGDPNYRGVTYSNFLAHGIDPIAKMLKEKGISYAVFTGKQTDKEKAQIIQDYNDGKIKQLLISGAGSEGLDLKGTKLMQLMEPHWNKSTLKQVKGRAIRFQSHAHLPEAERNVHVQRFYAKPPEKGFWIFKSQPKGSDEYMKMLAERKEALNQQFLNMLQEVGSEKVGFLKEAKNTPLYHYIKPYYLTAMIEKGGIVPTRRPAHGGQESLFASEVKGGQGIGISTTRLPKESAFTKRRSAPKLIRAKFTREKLRNKYKVKPIMEMSTTGRLNPNYSGLSEFEEIISFKGSRHSKPGVFPWKDVDRIEVLKPELKRRLKAGDKNIIKILKRLSKSVPVRLIKRAGFLKEARAKSFIDKLEGLKNSPLRFIDDTWRAGKNLAKMFKAKEEFAPGIPEARTIDPIDLKPGFTRMVLQEHDAKKAGKHFDLRLKSGDKAHSWALREFPTSFGARTGAIQQPTHTADYMGFEGKIDTGYGAGTVKKAIDEQVDITYADEKKIKFVSPTKGEFALINTGQGWILLKMKQFIGSVSSKPKYKEKAISALNPDKNTVWLPKYDGAHSVIELNPDEKYNRIYSYRKSKKTGFPIDHTHQLPQIRDLRVPSDLKNTVLRAEVFAKRNGKAVDATEVSGLLNSRFDKSRVGPELTPMIFNIEKFKGKDVSSKPYGEKLEMMKEINLRLPELKMSEIADTPRKKKLLLSKIESGKYPDTEEGVVEFDLSGATTTKAKIKNERDVYIRSINPGLRGFSYSTTKTGPIVGRVGTGFTASQWNDMKENPDKYIDSVARIASQQQYPSGAFRAPSFKLHVEKSLK